MAVYAGDEEGAPNFRLRKGRLFYGEEVNERLTKNMQNSFEAVWQMQQKYNVAPRLAAYMVALERLVIETTLRGYNC